MERRYAKDLRARSAEAGSPAPSRGAVTDSVDVRAFAMPPVRQQTKAQLPPPSSPNRSRRPRPPPGRVPHRVPRPPAGRCRSSRPNPSRTRDRPGIWRGIGFRIGFGELPALQGSGRSAGLRGGGRSARAALEGARAPTAYDRDALPRLHARRDRGGRRGTRVPVGARRARRDAELVHRVPARPGATPLHVHHGPPPGRGRGAAAQGSGSRAGGPPSTPVPTSPTTAPSRRPSSVCPRSRPTAAPSSSRPTTPSGSTSSVSVSGAPAGVQQPGIRAGSAAYVRDRAGRAPGHLQCRSGGAGRVESRCSSAAEPSEPEAEPAAEEGHEAAETAEVADDGRSDAGAPRPPGGPVSAVALRLVDQYEDGERPRAANE